MPRVLYGVSPIGLGHATRTLAVAGRLAKAGAEVRLFSGGVAADFLSRCGYPTDAVVSDPVPEVVNGEMKRTALWYLRSWVALKRTTGRTERLFNSFQPDIVVCDEEFSGIHVSMKWGCRNALISDELELGFARGRVAESIERRVERWYRNLQDSVELLIIPDFGADTGNQRHVEPIVRPITDTRDETRAKHGLPMDSQMVLFSMSGSGIGSFLLDRVVEAVSGNTMPDTFVAVSGNRSARVASEGVYDLGVVLDNQNLVAAADLVVSTAGKSTEDEAASAGTPFIGIPIRHHAEQERNAASLGYSHADAERLGELISQKVGRRQVPRHYNGAERASRLLMSVL
jgi:UDP-N-acetylglucosamine--N-acetylmuramyl-(pentapeptide) pyrophosphoryl-undecaprenol N-acetylglucosamine transferase